MRPRKASRKPQYAAAFELFCLGRDFASIAAEVGIDRALLERCAATQDWPRRRGHVLGATAVQAAETRLQAGAIVDSTLVSATRDAAQTLAAAYVKLIHEASALPTEPFADVQAAKMTEAERDRAHRHLIRDKSEIMKVATSGLRELIETAQGIGLLKVERGDGRNSHGRNGDDDKPIDLSKLTQLRIAIGNAAGGGVVVAELSAPTPPQDQPVNVTATDARQGVR